jgi:putative membrane protein
MKPFENLLSTIAKPTFVFAVCTALALPAFAEDKEKDKSSSQGRPGSSSTTQSGGSSQLSRTDEKFVKEAAKSGMMEVQMGNLGVQKAQNEQVKQFAQKLLTDHTRANQELKQFASTKGLTLPSESQGISGTTSGSSSTDAAGGPGSSTSATTGSSEAGAHDAGKHQMHAEMKKLQSMSGSEFDREFARQAVKHHQKSVREFEQASQRAEDQQLKAWIDKTLPTLREHLQTAQSLQASVGSGAGSPGTDSGTSSGTSTSGSNASGSSSSGSGSNTSGSNSSK